MCGESIYPVLLNIAAGAGRRVQRSPRPVRRASGARLDANNSRREAGSRGKSCSDQPQLCIDIVLPRQGDSNVGLGPVGAVGVGVDVGVGFGDTVFGVAVVDR